MKFMGRKVVVEYRYDSKEEAERHAKMMAHDGWKKEAVGHVLIPHFRSYSKREKEGAYL